MAYIAASFIGFFIALGLTLGSLGVCKALTLRRSWPYRITLAAACIFAAYLYIWQLFGCLDQVKALQGVSGG
jgi:hypothetical protein